MSSRFLLRNRNRPTFRAGASPIASTPQLPSPPSSNRDATVTVGPRPGDYRRALLFGLRRPSPLLRVGAGHSAALACTRSCTGPQLWSSCACACSAPRTQGAPRRLAIPRDTGCGQPSSACSRLPADTRRDTRNGTAAACVRLAAAAAIPPDGPAAPRLAAWIRPPVGPRIRRSGRGPGDNRPRLHALSYG